MKLYVDDIRIAPEGWTQAWTFKEAIEHLLSYEVVELSLDHDLGSSLGATGYDIMKWIELEVELEGMPLPEIQFHTSNPAGRANMQAAYDSILRRQENGNK